MRATAMILARVEDQRLSKAAEGIRNGTYRAKITLQTEEEVRGFVKKGDDKEYGCTITTYNAKEEKSATKSSELPLSL